MSKNFTEELTKLIRQQTDYQDDVPETVEAVLSLLRTHRPEKQEAEGWTGKENNRGAWNSGFNKGLDAVDKAYGLAE